MTLQSGEINHNRTEKKYKFTIMTNKTILEKYLGEKIKPENLLFYGTENGRSLGLTVYARSFVGFKIPESIDFDRCLKELRFFSAVLRVRKPSDVFYGWDSLYFSLIKRTIAFEILWYNEEYFKKRNKAYKSIFHERVFKDFGITADEINILNSLT